MSKEGYMRTINRTSACALIISADEKILHGLRDPKAGHSYRESYWLIPGGGIEPGETPAQALVREVREETGLDISAIPYELVDTDTGESTRRLDSGEEVLTKMQFNTFKIQLPTTAEETKLTLPEEFLEFRWTEPSELKDLKIIPASVRLFKRIGYL